jgi:hypothetical protein
MGIGRTGARMTGVGKTTHPDRAARPPQVRPDRSLRRQGDHARRCCFLTQRLAWRACSRAGQPWCAFMVFSLDTSCQELLSITYQCLEWCLCCGIGSLIGWIRLSARRLARPCCAWLIAVKQLGAGPGGDHEARWAVAWPICGRCGSGLAALGGDQLNARELLSELLKSIRGTTACPTAYN